MTIIRDWGTAIVSALANALNLVLAFVPRLIGFLVILFLGWVIALGVSKGVTALLRRVGFDRLADRIGLTRFEQRMGISMDAAGLLGKIVYWFVFLIFLVPATDALGLATVSNVINQIVDYLPNVFVAILILFLGVLAATVVADLVRGATATSKIGNPVVFANIARYIILGFVALVALEQLQIAPSLLNILFTAVIGAGALATGLAFGLGGQDTVRRFLGRKESSLGLNTPMAPMGQEMEQGRTVPPAVPEGQRFRRQVS